MTEMAHTRGRPVPALGMPKVGGEFKKRALSENSSHNFRRAGFILNTLITGYTGESSTVGDNMKGGNK